MSFKSGISIENNFLKFIELKKYLVSNQNNSINSISVDNNEQNIFVANNKSLVVIDLNYLLNFVWNKSVVNEICQQFQHYSIELNFYPHLLSISGKGFGSKLAVCGTHGLNETNDSPFIVFFDLRDVYRNKSKSVCFNRINLSNCTGVVHDIVWHPEVSDNQFGCILSDGSVFIIAIGDFETKTTAILSHISSSKNAISLCWSPKGKQLVVGFKSGYFSQYKLINGQQLQEVKKTVLPNSLNDYNVMSIKWIVSALFAIAISKDLNDLEKDTHIVMVSTPSKGLPQFVDFGSICLDNNEVNDSYRIQLLHFDNIILCSTSMASEVSVIGCDSDKDISNPDNWCHWMLEDSSRIDLPMDSDGNDTYLRGIVVSKGTQNTYQINSNEVYGGINCPILFVHNSSGLLVPYLIVDKSGKIRAPEPLHSVKPSVNTIVTHNKIITSTPIMALNDGQQTKVIPKPSISSFTPVPTFTPVISSTTNVSKPENIGTNERTTIIQTSHPKSQSIESQKHFSPQNIASTPNTSSTELKSAQTTTQTIGSTSTEEAANISAHNLYLNALTEQINDFNKVMNETKRKYLKINANIGEKDEQMKIKTDTRLIEDVLNEIKDNFRNCSKDTTTLQSSLLESFSLLEEAKSIMDRNVDPNYRHLLKQRALDPITNRRMQEIHNLNEYIEIQLRELDAKFEQEWYEWLDKRKSIKSKQHNRNQTNSEIIYKSLVNNQRIINSLKLQLENLHKFSSLKYKTKSTLIKDKKNEDSNKKIIDKLSQSLSKSCIKDILEDSQNERIFKLKTISKEKKINLKQFLESRTKVPVRRSVDVINNNSSRFISAIAKLKDKQKTCDFSNTSIGSNVSNNSLESFVLNQSSSKSANFASTEYNSIKSSFETPKANQNLKLKLTSLSLPLTSNSNTPTVNRSNDSLNNSTIKTSEVFPITSKSLIFNLNNNSLQTPQKSPLTLTNKITPTVTQNIKFQSDIESNVKESVLETPSMSTNVSKTVSFGNTTIINPIESPSDSFKLDTITECTENNDNVFNTNSPFTSFKGFGGNVSAIESDLPKLSFNVNPKNPSFTLRGDSNLDKPLKSKNSLPKYEDISPPITPNTLLPEDEPNIVSNSTTDAELSKPLSILKTTLSTKTLNQNIQKDNNLLIAKTTELQPITTTIRKADSTISISTATASVIESTSITTTPITSTSITSTPVTSTPDTSSLLINQTTTIAPIVANESMAQINPNSDQLSSSFSQTPFASNSFSFGNITSNASAVTNSFNQGFSFGGSTGFTQTNSNPNVSSPSSTGTPTFGQQTSALNSLSFCGLGGRPTPENAQKNAFGGNFSNPPLQTSPQFTPTSQSSPFNVKSVTFGGSFTSGSGVAQTGFAPFQQSPPQTSQPVFGGSPIFGSGQQPAFGGSPTFGAPVPQQSAFGSAPTFGSPPVMGSMSPFGGAQTNSTFGASIGFTNSSNNGLSFGAIASSAQQTQQNTSPFGSQFAFNSSSNSFGATDPQSFSFTQRRK